ncbi:MAG TPA: DUF6067 family protein [Planctomycetota bacterium]|nr:DUF6067 family protein [Planctomycetota bacterium]HRR79304.1 DUF6067 family protein [Planctomycetota bacterium]HRT95637.1 DUF6067 family protein [Planctomycetota bacterium]
MRTRRFLCLLLFAARVAGGAELDLFVTDYNLDPKADQRPLAARPVTYGSPQEVTIKAADGRAVTFKAPAAVTVQRTSAGGEREARLFAALGEYEPFSFLLRPRQALEEVFITSSDLQGPAGAIPASHVSVTSVEHFLGEGRDILMPLGKPWNMAAHSTEFFWCTVQVPEDAKAGTYQGKVTVTSKGQPVGAIAVTLEVLPIRLADPPFALGYNYSSPKDDEALNAHLADMRRHGMTCVAPLYEFHLPVNDADTSELGKFIEAYKRAGFPAPLYFATPMELQLTTLAGYGAETSKRWQQKFLQVMRRLHAETQKHNVPVLMSIGDELTNKGIEGVKIAENLARFAWEELPEIATTSDMNGYREVMAMAPWLNVATFNNGWDGIDHHNQGRTLINQEFIEELQQKTGAIPWFVNAGTGRFPFGFFFWRMTKFGVRGKVEWYYNLRNERGSVVRTRDATVYPTLDYERSREGIDDLKYLCKLESLVAEAKRAGKGQAECARAEAVLGKIAESIRTDWSAYTSGGAKFPADGFDLLDPEKMADLGGLDALRRLLADEIVALQAAMR